MTDLDVEEGGRIGFYFCAPPWDGSLPRRMIVALSGVVDDARFGRREAKCLSHSNSFLAGVGREIRCRRT